MAQTIVLSNSPNQSFSEQLVVNGKALTLNFSLKFNEMAGYWDLAISNVQGQLLIASVPFLTGLYPASNLLAQYQYLRIGSAFLLNTGNSTTDYPNSLNLNLYTLVWDDNV